jgi:hypothetical protein
MKISTTQMLNILYIFSWIIFIGLCIQAGGFIFNTFFTIAINPSGARRFWQEADLSGLHAYDLGHYLALTVIMCIVAISKAIIFYLIVKMLYDKKLNLSKPFSPAVVRFIVNIAYLSLLTGLFSAFGAKHCARFVKLGVAMPDLQQIGLSGADVWLFMGVTLIVIAQIFKRGIELQSENELTV